MGVVTVSDIKISLSIAEAEVLRDAVEILARIHMGQFDVVEHEIWNGIQDRAVSEVSAEIREHIEGLAKASGLSGKGIRSTPERAKMAWDAHQVLRNLLAYHKKPEGGMETCYTAPVFVSPASKIQATI